MRPSVQIEVSIPSAAVVNPADGKAYTAYTVVCRLPLRTYTVAKRYSEFVALNTALASQARGNVAIPYQLPPKHWFTSTLNNPVLTEERRIGLEAYLRGVLTDPDSRWRETAAWRSFLNLPANSQTAGSGATRDSLHASITGPGSADRIHDPAVWLDTHRELVTMLQGAREHLAARNLSMDARSAQEEGSAAKKLLVRAGTLVSALDQGLKRSGKAGDFDVAMSLGDGELRRRRDLLTAARRERERLEELQVNIGKKEDVDQDVRGLEKRAENSTEAADNGGSLFASSRASPGSSRKGVGKGRVIGKETARTRELENAGVLQLQQQLMKEQDEDVNSLAAAVRRQRQLAIEINTELEVQNEMLGMLEEDTGTLQRKLDVAKKRVDKIS